jgi:hypothetical protein
MANRWGLKEVFGLNLKGTKLFHGSPCLINDKYMASGTFFTPDATVAMQYGPVIYSIEVPDKALEMFCPDSLKEHLYTRCLIPLSYFDVDDTTFQGDDEELFL